MIRPGLWLLAVVALQPCPSVLLALSIIVPGKELAGARATRGL